MLPRIKSPHNRWGIRFCRVAIMCWLMASLCLVPASFAFAEQGAIKAPEVKETLQHDSVQVSADNLSAKLEGVPFAIDNFDRANVGSNRAIAGEYAGYAYYIGQKASGLMYMVTNKVVVVYVNETSAKEASFDINSTDDLALLQSIILAIDKANAKGNTPMGNKTPWYFTSEKEVTIEGVVYSFDRVIDDGNYDTICGPSGEDVTSSGSDKVAPGFACFANLVPTDKATIAAEPTWFESLGSFLSTLDWSPLWITLKTTLTAIVFIFLLGLAAAYVCLQVPAKVRDILDTLFTIPMVLPPTVCGFLLLLGLGSNTALGKWFIDIGFPLIYSWPATVLAAITVAFPLMYRNAIGAFESLDANMLDAARTLGWSELRIFFRIMLPLSWSSIAAGTVLAFARALGEFGATLFLAGNYLGITQTIPIAIYFQWMNGNNDIAIFWTIVLIIFSFLVIAFINMWARHTTRYRRGVVEE